MDTQILKNGFTTGSCAAAAAKAAAIMLYEQKKINFVNIRIPGYNYEHRTFEIKKIELKKEFVKCCVIKNAGTDNDVTNGIEIWVKAVKQKKDYFLTGGEGIGIVTKDGLYVNKNEYAINPVPKKMIKNEVMEVLKKHQGIKIKIFVPKGKEIAKKTFNERLGIVGGISIIGTTGIVTPMSSEALKKTIELEIHQKSILGFTELILVFGKMGEKFCIEHGLEKNKIVLMSNFVGTALKSCEKYNIRKIIIAGHIGKLCKVSAGCFNTHSSVNDLRLEILFLELAFENALLFLIKQIYNLNTTENAVKMISSKYNNIYKKICKKIQTRIYNFTNQSCKSDVILYSQAKGLLCDTRSKI